MEGSPESGVDLEILGITKFPREEEDVRTIRSFVERGEVPHHIWVYLLAVRRSKMGKDLAHN